MKKEFENETKPKSLALFTSRQICERAGASLALTFVFLHNYLAILPLLGAWVAVFLVLLGVEGLLIYDHRRSPVGQKTDNKGNNENKKND